MLKANYFWHSLIKDKLHPISWWVVGKEEEGEEAKIMVATIMLIKGVL